jgi:exopolyphosphatase / guanosine-5'-triphosphate,3'-diphosphate pyrophosphatase
MKRIAVIDCGTNTFNLLIVEILRESPEKLFSTRIPVKLGQNGINQQHIAEAPYLRGIEALRNFQTSISNHEVNHVLAFATSAIRDAKNGRQFVEDAKRLFDISIKVIDGEEEARLIYEGNRKAVTLSDKRSLIMDIGGGSTEFILCNQHEVLWKQSFQLGAARLLEQFKPSDPIRLQEISDIELFLKKELVPLTNAILKFGNVEELIGSSGAFDSLIDMIQGELGGESIRQGKTEYVINLSDYKKIADKVIVSTYQERMAIKGLIEMRVDMMVISCLLINTVLHNYTVPCFKASTYSLKEGALFDYISKTGRSY